MVRALISFSLFKLYQICRLALEMSVHDFSLTFFEIFDHQFFSYFENKTQGVFEAKKGKFVGFPFNVVGRGICRTLPLMWISRMSGAYVLKVQESYALGKKTSIHM
eukprot:GHVP01011057.1.p1 GENE.GHVP01011057.1~~GHVP01011057.1.p1  ORF type:complete len:106 (+),score=2.50 GHVP01011057.1:133-450(+)